MAGAGNQMSGGMTTEMIPFGVLTKVIYISIFIEWQVLLY